MDGEEREKKGEVRSSGVHGDVSKTWREREDEREGERNLRKGERNLRNGENAGERERERWTERWREEKG